MVITIKYIYEKKMNLPHPILVYTFNFIFSAENVSTTSIYKYRPEREKFYL